MSDQSQTCAPMWDDVNQGAVSLTELQGMPGADEYVEFCGSGFNGAEFMEIKHMASPHYERLMSQVVPAPWLGQPGEVSYMNRVKMNNEAPSETYRQLKLSTLPNENYGTVEGFGGDNFNIIFKVLLLLCLLVFIYYIMNEMK